MPTPGVLAPGDAVVVDVNAFDASPPPEHFAPVLPRADVCLVVGDGLVSAGWLLLSDLARERVHVVRCSSVERLNGFRPVLAFYEETLRGPGPDRIVQLVLDVEPVLRPLTNLVEVVLQRPWEVRHLKDVAMHSSIPLRTIRTRCWSAGFTRVEHFITAVRLIAYEQLAKTERCSLAQARRLAGIADWSNLRRQWRRACARSSAAVGRLESHFKVVLLCLSALAAACDGGSPGQDGTARAEAAPADSAIAVPVAGAVVRRGDLVLTVRTTGQVRAERLVALKAEAQGTAQAVEVHPGDRVRGGDVLVRLDPRPFDLAVREAQAGVADALVRYRDILIGDDTTDASGAAVERRRNARLRAGLDAAEARAERATLERERATIRAPFRSTVDAVHVVVGQGVAVGQAIATVVDLGSLQIEAAVLEHDLPLIKRGALAWLTVSAVPDSQYAGSVVAVLPLVDTVSRAGRALVRVRGTKGVLRPGMYADVELEASRLPDRVLVPAAAVVERDGRPLVFRYRGGRAEWVYVTVGRSNGRETEVVPNDDAHLAPILAGDTVIVGGHMTLAHHAPVRLVSPTKP